MTVVTERISAALADRYRILRHLGAGGMATVYLAEDLKHDRKVAIKVLKPELAAVLGAERFVVEIKTTAALQHPHILPLFDSGTADSFLFYVMPYIEGETLRDKLNRESQLGVDEAVRIASDIADALDYAHRHGVIHRDIKPENILLHDGRPMVADFGIALAVSAAAGGRMTETGLSLGTPHYMSPEQATAEKEITARSDVYSLASVLYEMLAGEPPHLGGTAQQIIMKIITDRARPVTDLRKSVPAHVAAALAKALEKLPADRFASAKEFREALLNPGLTLAGGTRTSWSGAGAAAGAQSARRRFAIASTVAVFASIAALAAWLRAAPEESVVRTREYVPDSLELTSMSGTRMALSPDGRTIAYVTGDGSEARIWVRHADELTARALPGTEYAANLGFSPDGSQLAFVSMQLPRAVRVVPVAGGPVLTLTDSLVDAGGLSWGGDGFIYFDGHLEGDGTARVREVGGAAPEIASMPDSGKTERYHYMPSALPDGRGTLFTVARGSRSEWTIAAQRRPGEPHRELVTGVRAHYSPTGHLLYATVDGQLMAVRFDLKSLEVAGDPVLITDGVAVRSNARADFSLSAAGDLAYVLGPVNGARRELVWVSRDGSARAVDARLTAELDGWMRLSPDGRRVSYAVGTGDSRSLWVKDLDDGPSTRVAERGAQGAWTPDGRSLVYGTLPGIAITAADGSTAPRAISQTGHSPTVSPDGRWVVYCDRGGIVARRLDGDSSLVTLVSEAGTQLLPALSPDGRWLAYASDGSGGWQVFVRPFPNAAASRRQVSVSGGYGPLWSRSGRELFFYSVDSMFVSQVTTGAAFTSGNPRALFGVAQYPVAGSPPDVTPDGQRFIVQRPVGSETSARDQIVWVRGFASELRARFK